MTDMIEKQLTDYPEVDKMSFGSVYLLFLVLLIDNSRESASPTELRSYILSKDFWIGYKAGEFSIFNTKKPLIQYRIESNYALGQKIQLIKSSTREVIAKLKSIWSSNPLRTRFAIRHASSECWINGTLSRIATKPLRKYIIHWNNTIVVMTNVMNGSTLLENEEQDETLATFTAISTSILGSKNYLLRIFSDVLPDAVFFLAIAVEDAFRQPKARG